MFNEKVCCPVPEPCREDTTSEMLVETIGRLGAIEGTLQDTLYKISGSTFGLDPTKQPECLLEAIAVISLKSKGILSMVDQIHELVR